MPNVVLVVAGGDPPGMEVVAALPPVDMVICADKGIEHAQANNWDIDVCVGDFDSVEPDQLRETETSGIEVLRFPKNKDSTDLALALDLACERDADQIIVIGIGGGRLDHLFGNINLLANSDYDQVEIIGLVGTAKISVVHTSKKIVGTPGEHISLFAANGDARGVTSEGLKYVLANDTLVANSSLGVSNEFVETSALLQVTEGAVIAIQPEHLTSCDAPEQSGGRP